MAVVGVSLFCLAIGLNSGVVLLSSSAILIFVGSFAVGLGPVPYVLVGELVPFYVRIFHRSFLLLTKVRRIMTGFVLSGLCSNVVRLGYQFYSWGWIPSSTQLAIDSR